MYESCDTETLKGNRARDPYRMSSAQIRVYYVFELISLFLFYAGLVMILATVFANIFNVPHVYHESRGRIITVRRQNAAVLLLPQCRLYFGNVTKEEEIIFKKNDAHVLSTESCTAAQSYMHEGEWTQTIREVMNHYAVCESGTCDHLIEWIVRNSIYMLAFVFGAFALYIYMNPAQRPVERIMMYTTDRQRPSVRSAKLAAARG